MLCLGQRKDKSGAGQKLFNFMEQVQELQILCGPVRLFPQAVEGLDGACLEDSMRWDLRNRSLQGRGSAHFARLQEVLLACLPQDDAAVGQHMSRTYKLWSDSVGELRI